MTSEPEPSPSQEFIRRLMSPERSQILDTFMILSFSGINLHDTVADIGCGPGFFAVPLGKYLVNGKLYALDIDDEMLGACRENVAQARLGNVEVLKCGEFDFPPDKGSLDGGFLAFVVHRSPDKPRLLGAIRELLQPRGWCTILEWYRKETEDGPPLELRVGPEEMAVLAGEAGFRNTGWREVNADQYMMTLRNG